MAKKYHICTRSITTITYEVEADDPESAKIDATKRAFRRLHRGRVKYENRIEADAPEQVK
jgi:hypothetical protein